VVKAGDDTHDFGWLDLDLNALAMSSEQEMDTADHDVDRRLAQLGDPDETGFVIDPRPDQVLNKAAQYARSRLGTV
jgi:hypothetical protein